MEKNVCFMQYSDKFFDIISILKKSIFLKES